VTRADIEEIKLAVKEGKTAGNLPARPRGRRIIKGGAGIANRTIALLSKMFSCAESWGVRDGNPARGIQKFPEKRCDRFLDSKEVIRLQKALAQAEKEGTVSLFAIAAIRLLLFSGLRLGEVTNLRWKDIEISNAAIRLRDTKTGDRTVPMNQQVLNIVVKLPKGTPNSLIIQSCKSGAPISLTRPWYRIRNAAGIDESATLHTLRHTFASWCVMGGLSLPQVGALLGHKSAQTTLRYADHRQDALRQYSDHTANILVSLENIPN